MMVISINVAPSVVVIFVLGAIVRPPGPSDVSIEKFIVDVSRVSVLVAVKLPDNTPPCVSGIQGEPCAPVNVTVTFSPVPVGPPLDVKVRVSPEIIPVHVAEAAVSSTTILVLINVPLATIPCKGETSIVIVPFAAMAESVIVITGDVFPVLDTIFSPSVIVRPPITGATSSTATRNENTIKEITLRFFMKNTRYFASFSSSVYG
jgi:hypothetical protein